MDKYTQEKETQENIYHRAKTWQVALFYLCSGSGMAFYVLMNLVSYIANGGYGVLVASIGVIMTASRILDGITDPLIALIVDRVNTKHGKIRLFMWLGWGIEAIACISMFVLFSNGQHGIFLFVCLYFLYIIGYTFFGVSTNVCGPVLTNDPKQRPMLARWNTLYSYLFPMIFNMGVTLVILPAFGNEYSVPMLSRTCQIVVAVSAVLVFLSTIGIKEYDKTENFVFTNKEDKETNIGFKEMISFMKGNNAFLRYVVACASDKLAAATAGQAIVITMFYGILIGNMQLGSIFSVITMLPSIVFLFISTRVAAKKGNEESMLIWTWAAIGISAIAVVFCCFADMTSIMKEIIPTVVFFVIMLVLSGVKMGISATSGAMLSDIIDYEMSRTGNFMPGTAAATYSFIDKLISAFSAMVATGCVALIGYRTVLPQPTDPSSPAIFAMTMFLMYGLPVIGWICTVIAMRGYSLTREKMVEVQTINKQIRDASGNSQTA